MVQISNFFNPIYWFIWKELLPSHATAPGKSYSYGWLHFNSRWFCLHDIAYSTRTLRIECHTRKRHKTARSLATKIHVCFETAKSCFNSKKTVVSQYPLRFSKSSLSSSSAHEQLGLDQARTTQYLSSADLKVLYR